MNYITSAELFAIINDESVATYDVEALYFADEHYFELTDELAESGVSELNFGSLTF